LPPPDLALTLSYVGAAREARLEAHSALGETLTEQVAQA
jgi:tRNA threonylcarbamoyladenosine biosynthesis protein TsaE